MESMTTLIDKARLKSGLNYTEIGTRLDRSKQLVTNWRKGAKVPGDGDVMALSRMAGEDPDKWLAIAQAARSEGEARARWNNIAKKLAATTAMAALCAIGLSMPLIAKASDTGHCLLCQNATSLPGAGPCQPPNPVICSLTMT